MLDEFGEHKIKLGYASDLTVTGVDLIECDHCRGAGTDPMADHMLPCPACDGEGRTTGGE